VPVRPKLLINKLAKALELMVYKKMKLLKSEVIRRDFIEEEEKVEIEDSYTPYTIESDEEDVRGKI
jgi:hypothetical protein